MDSVLRRLQAALRQRRAGMARACADDLAVALRSARKAADVAPVFVEAERVAGLRLKPSKCKALVVAHGMQSTQAQALRDGLVAGAP